MCGIFGYIGAENLNSERVLAALHHRGPDSQGTWKANLGAKQIHLLHTRLAIIDLSPAGHQPMVDVITGNVVVFNGEIYNFLELRQELKAHGLVFHSQSDTEVLLLGYRVWGEKLIERLDGMFAFLLFDQNRQRLLVARDHVGIKPLYYAYTQGGGIAFASEVRALISSELVATDWDEQSIYDYLVYGSIQEPRTIRQAIKAFPSAHYSWVDLQQDRVTLTQQVRYWNLGDLFYKQTQITPPSASQNTHTEVLQSTLKNQLIAEVPVGLFLSSGIDSTALACSLAPISNNRMSTFTFDLQNSSKNESFLAAMTAQQLNLKHYTADLSQETLATWLLDSFAAMDQPSSDGTNTYLISRASRAYDITVVLSGSGADELHGGYPHFSSLVSLYKFAQKVGIMKSVFLPCIEKVKGWGKNSIYRERLQLLLQRSNSPRQMVDEVRRYFTPNQISDFWTGAQDYEQTTMPCKHKADISQNFDIETQICLSEVEGYLQNTLLRDSDWATMANQQELRVPYLGKSYIETVCGIPWSEKRTTKAQKKPLLASQIPKSFQNVLKRQKTGFDLDYNLYLSSSLRECMHTAFTYLNQTYDFKLNTEQLERDLKIGDPAKQARRYWALTSLGFYLHQHS